MILPALALALLAAGAPVNAQRSSVLVNRLASQGSGWRVMSSAANQLSKRKLSKADVNALRKLLAAELEQRPLRLAGSTEHVCARHEPWQCSVDIGECLPRAGFIAIVFEKRGDLARQALPELRALAERTDAGSARMIALVAITAAGDPKARDAAVTLLRSRDYDCVSAGLGLFAGRALSAEDRRELEHALLGG